MTPPEIELPDWDRYKLLVLGNLESLAGEIKALSNKLDTFRRDELGQIEKQIAVLSATTVMRSELDSRLKTIETELAKNAGKSTGQVAIWGYIALGISIIGGVIALLAKVLH